MNCCDTYDKKYGIRVKESIRKNVLLPNVFFTNYQTLEKNKQKEFVKTIIERKSGLKMNQTNEIREKVGTKKLSDR